MREFLTLENSVQNTVVGEWFLPGGSLKKILAIAYSAGVSNVRKYD